MKIGVTLRNMGHQSSPDIMLAGARRAEELGFDSLWITDHIAIPPDDAEGSGGRYTDPLTTLAWLAGQTTTIKLGIGVLIIPYRTTLPTIKQIATVQELSGNRLTLGAAVGWMDPEFKALGVNRHARGKITDEFLSVYTDYFNNEVITLNDQALLTKPHPPMPTTFIGGAAKHALKRAVKFGHGWLPMTRDPATLANDIKQFESLAADNGTTRGPVVAMTSLPLDKPEVAAEHLDGFRQTGIEGLVCAMRYEGIEDYSASLQQLASLV